MLTVIKEWIEMQGYRTTYLEDGRLFMHKDKLTSSGTVEVTTWIRDWKSARAAVGF